MKENKTTTSAQSFQMFTYCPHNAAVLTPCNFCVSGNMSRLVLSTCCCQSCTFERNPLILSVFVSRFSFRPCICVFSSFRCWNISAMYASLAHHLSLASSFASSHVSLVKTPSVPPAAHSYRPTLSPILCPATTHRTSVWSNKTLCSAHISSHKMQIYADF